MEFTKGRSCCGCGQSITDQYILRVSPDLEWHSSCLRCSECEGLLHEMNTCFVKNGKIFCKVDYSRLFGVKCRGCRRGFYGSDLVMRTRDWAYHVDCFRCATCNRQLVPGDEYALDEDRGLLCRADHEALLLKTSSYSDLGEKAEKRSMSLDKSRKQKIEKVNNEGFVTTADGTELKDESLFPSSGFFSMPASECVKDAKLILKHSRSLTPTIKKDRKSNSSSTSRLAKRKNLNFKIDNNNNGEETKIINEEDSTTTSASDIHDDDDEDDGRLVEDEDDDEDSNCGAEEESYRHLSGSQRKHLKHQNKTSTHGQSHHHHHHQHHCSGLRSQPQKTTRVRTVLNERQLHTLRTCYGANPRPDALMKEQLVEMTGLSPRVIRVWFQNKRCKDKKKSIMLKQLQHQQQNLSQSDSNSMRSADDEIWNAHKTSSSTPPQSISRDHNHHLGLNLPPQLHLSNSHQHHLTGKRESAWEFPYMTELPKSAMLKPEAASGHGHVENFHHVVDDVMVGNISRSDEDDDVDETSM